MEILFGAAPDTSNQGVTALCQSVVRGLAVRGIAPITVVGNTGGPRRERWRLGGDMTPVDRFSITPTRRVWREDSLARTAFCARTRLPNARARAIAAARTVLDVSGGDSFTDLYGQRRFDAIVRPKELAIALGRPLVLLPQTIGPFLNESSLARATRALRAARAVFTRDARSEERLRTLLGDTFDPARHVTGVDMAVTLPQSAPEDLPDTVRSWLASPTPVAGLNVSGLLANDPHSAVARFGLAARHTDAALAIACAVLSDPSVRLLLIPHVTVPDSHLESDHAACRALEARLAARFPGRVATLPNRYDASELKWVIAQLSWFAGARMHATIAAFSSGVPTLGLAYSDKFAGVFEACRIGSAVADLRQLDAGTLGAAAAASFTQRTAMANHLAIHAAALTARAEAQMDEIAAIITGKG